MKCQSLVSWAIILSTILLLPQTAGALPENVSSVVLTGKKLLSTAPATAPGKEIATYRVSLANSGDCPVAGLLALVEFTKGTGRPLQALGGPTDPTYDGHWYYDLAAKLGGGDLEPGNTVTFKLRLRKKAGARVNFIIVPLGTLPQEICGDSIDNDCDGEVDESCPPMNCGDGNCDPGENPDNCPADCPPAPP